MGLKFGTEVGFHPGSIYHWLGLGVPPPIPVLLEDLVFLGKLPLFSAGSFGQIRYMTSPRDWALPNSKY